MLQPFSLKFLLTCCSLYIVNGKWPFSSTICEIYLCIDYTGKVSNRAKFELQISNFPTHRIEPKARSNRAKFDQYRNWMTPWLTTVNHSTRRSPKLPKLQLKSSSRKSSKFRCQNCHKSNLWANFGPKFDAKKSLKCLCRKFDLDIDWQVSLRWIPKC